MRQLLQNGLPDQQGAAQVHFALGKALEQRELYPEAFAQYAQGNALRRLVAPFDIERFERRCERIRTFFDKKFFAARQGAGDPSDAPIFIVGLPRSGSTLVEQILASHPQVQGTMELPDILIVTRELDAMAPRRDGYPETIGKLDNAQLTAFGTRYIEQTAPLRSGRERFIDKMPNNFSHVGLIHPILPNATSSTRAVTRWTACFALTSSTSRTARPSATTSTISADTMLVPRADGALGHGAAGEVLHVSLRANGRDPEGTFAAC